MKNCSSSLNYSKGQLICIASSLSLLHKFLCLPYPPVLGLWSRCVCPPVPLSHAVRSGDSAEPRAPAAGQWTFLVPALSWDHQWDVHPRARAKLARRLPPSHAHHPGLCVPRPLRTPHWPSSVWACSSSVLCCGPSVFPWLWSTFRVT